MIKNTFYVLAFFLSLSLQNLTHSKEPKWVNDPESSCPAGFICAVGAADFKAEAQAAARTELAKFFSTKVKSTQTHSQSVSSSGDIASDSSVEEEFSKEIEESTEEILNGVEINKTHNGDEAYYAYARLSKRKTGNLLKERMQNLDRENVVLFEKAKRSSVFKLLKNLKLRAFYQEKYVLLKGTPYKNPVSKTAVLKLKKRLAQKAVTIFLNVEEVSENEEVKNLILKELLALDYKIVTDKNKKFDFKVNVKLEAEKLFMNVKGFEKYRFNLVALSYAKNDSKKGGVEHSITQVGRDRSNAYANALPGLRKYIEDNVGSLNID